MNKRDAQLTSEIERVVAQLLARGLSDPRVRGLITITAVTLSEDRRTARIGVSVLPVEHEALTMHGLRAASGHLRRQAMDRVKSRSFPALEFVADDSIRKQNEVLAAIARATADRQQHEDSADTAPAGERTGDDGATP